MIFIKTFTQSKDFGVQIVTVQCALKRVYTADCVILVGCDVNHWGCWKLIFVQCAWQVNLLRNVSKCCIA